MAHDDLSLSIGLNEIASLSGHNMDSETRRKTGLSRIPKINFSFRHKASPARTASPEGDSGDRNGIGSVKSAPNSKRGSPVSRSKSLRLPRSNYIAKCHSSSAVASMGRQEEEEEELGGGKRGLQRDSRVSHLKPRARANTGTISNPGSRSSSPAGLRMTPQSLTDSSSSSTELQFEANGGITEAPSPHFHRRSQSFHSSARQRTQARASNLSVRDRGVVRPSSAGRSKTPTSSSRYGSHKTATSSSEPRNMPITRTNSVGQIVKESSNSRSSTPPRRVYRTDSSGSLSSTSRRSKGKRPSSVIVTDNTADLNKLAQEIAGSFVMSETSEPEMKSVSRVSSETSQVRRRSGTFTRIPTVRGVKSPTDRGSSSSPTEKDPKSYEQPTVSSRAKLLHGRRSLDQDSSQRPNSARAYYSYQQTPPHETTQATARGEEETLRSQPSAEKLPADETDFGVRAAVAAVSKRTRSSTPSSSGRGSPVPKEDKVSLKQGSRTSPTGEGGSGSGQVPMVTVSRVTGLPPRTPYRVARTRASTLAGSELAMGINELQGSVLLEADDYRRISNDVRGLKTALLRLKRELQGDVSLCVRERWRGREGGREGGEKGGKERDHLLTSLQRTLMNNSNNLIR